MRQHPEVKEIRFWCDKKFEAQARAIMAKTDASVPVATITAGKLRRYHHLKWWQHIIDLTVLLPNLRDMMKVVAGLIQAFIELLLWRPDVVFTKGGYVCLPVGWAAHLLNIPLVVHDSDAHPGLTNRLLARHATFIATGAPLECYSYPKEKSQFVGIPISDQFYPRSASQKHATKQKLGFDPNLQLVVVTGGGLGAKRINDAVAKDVDNLTTYYSVLLISGAAQFDELKSRLGGKRQNFVLKSFISEGMADIIGAADVVVARAGASTLLELAAAHAPTVLVPNARLTGGHQVKNAKVYDDAQAVVVVDEEKFATQPDYLRKEIDLVLNNEDQLNTLAKNISKFAKPNAAKDVTAMILKAAKK